MHTGVIRSRYRKADLEEAIKQYRDKALPALATHPGNRSGLLLVNRETGDVISIGFYENEASAKAFAPKATSLLESFKKFETEPAEPNRELFEIAASTQQEAKAVVEKNIKAFNAHDMEALARQAAPDIVGTFPDVGQVKGPQAVKEQNQLMVRAFPDAKVEAKNTIAQGNTVVVEGVFTGTHSGPLKTPMGDVAPTGKKVAGEFIQVVEIDRGLVKRSHLIYDQVQLMQQLGLSPAAAPAKSKG
jgi:predicted ester cyclase